MRVFLLAKDFGHTQLVLQLAETNLFRGQKWYCFGSKSALDSLLVAYYADFATPFHVPLLHRSAVG